MDRVPCPNCGERNLAQDPICLGCGQPTHRRIPQERRGAPAPTARRRPPALLLRLLLTAAGFLAAVWLIALLLKPPSLSVLEWLRQPGRADAHGRTASNLGQALFLAALFVGFVAWLLRPPHWRDFEEKPESYHDGTGMSGM